MKSLFLFPGSLTLVSNPTEITTVLGSCVSVVLHDPVLRVTAMNHYLLSEGGEQEAASPELNFRYGIHAIPELVVWMGSLGIPVSRLQAKVYGGADVLHGVELGQCVGKNNIKLAEIVLADYTIPIIESDTGGTRARKIVVNSHTFEVFHHLMNGAESDRRRYGT